jgi:hypothetical protein
MGYQIKEGKIIEESQELSCISTDVVVAGGGPAGFSAAVSAARAGAKVTLVESRTFLGGVATQAMMAALVGARGADGISRELIDEMTKLGGAPSFTEDRKRVDTIPFDPEIFKQAALEMVINAGVKLLFYTNVCGPIVINGECKGIIVENKAGRSAILAKQTIDCTGDADLAYRAGVPCNVGRPGDNKTRPLTLIFRLGNIEVSKMVDYVEKNPEEVQPHYRGATPLTFNGSEKVLPRISGFYKLVEEAKANGDLYDEIYYFRLENLQIDRKIAYCNTVRVYYLNGTNPEDLTKAEIEARRKIQKIYAFARKYIPGCENSFIIDLSSSLGVRETRRIVGEYQVTDEDAYGNKMFDDAFMTSNGRLVTRPRPPELDVHMPDPIEGSEKDWLERYPEKVPYEPHTYQLPFRCLIPKDMKNMLVAGRSISVSHMIDQHTRNMIPCMRFGQVAGTGAALSALNNVSPKDMDFSLVRKELIHQGLHL